MNRYEEAGQNEFVAITNDQMVLLNNGKMVTDRIYEDAGNFSDGIIPLKYEGKWGYVDNEYNDAEKMDKALYDMYHIKLSRDKNTLKYNQFAAYKNGAYYFRRINDGRRLLPNTILTRFIRLRTTFYLLPLM